MPLSKYYKVGSRKGQILQARLRLGCSLLKSDLYRKHIVISPSCQCGDFESAPYLLFNCTIYTNERQIFLQDNLRTYTTNTPASNLEYLAPPGQFFTGAKLFIGTPWMGNEGVLKKQIGLGYVKLHGFYGNP